MDYSYTFHQAHQDRLEDAGLKSQKNHIMNTTSKPKRKNTSNPIKRLVIATVNTLVK